MKMQIILSDLNEKPCKRYDYLEGKAFNPIEEIKKQPKHFWDVDYFWLLTNCEIYQTEKAVEIYVDEIDTKIDFYVLAEIIKSNSIYQTQKNLQLYLKWNKANRVSFADLLIDCIPYQTQENWLLYLKMNEHKNFVNLSYLIVNCESYQTIKNLKLYFEWNLLKDSEGVEDSRYLLKNLPFKVNFKLMLVAIKEDCKLIFNKIFKKK